MVQPLTPTLTAIPGEWMSREQTVNLYCMWFVPSEKWETCTTLSQVTPAWFFHESKLTMDPATNQRYTETIKNNALVWKYGQNVKRKNGCIEWTQDSNPAQADIISVWARPFLPISCLFLWSSQTTLSNWAGAKPDALEETCPILHLSLSQVTWSDFYHLTYVFKSPAFSLLSCPSSFQLSFLLISFLCSHFIATVLEVML